MVSNLALTLGKSFQGSESPGEASACQEVGTKPGALTQGHVLGENTWGLIAEPAVHCWRTHGATVGKSGWRGGCRPAFLIWTAQRLQLSLLTSQNCRVTLNYIPEWWDSQHSPPLSMLSTPEGLHEIEENHSESCRVPNPHRGRSGQRSVARFFLVCEGCQTRASGGFLPLALLPPGIASHGLMT